MPLPFKYAFFSGVLAHMILSGSWLTAQSYLPETDADYRYAREVYDKVWSAYGRQSAPPELAIRKGVASARDIAFYQTAEGKVRPTVVLDAEVVPLLKGAFREEAPAALACILAHELAHHHHGHSKTAHFAAKSVNTVQEGQADESGFFYAYLAGYSSFAVAERLFEVLYEKYGLDKRGADGYPSKKERLAAIRAKVDEVKIWANVYEAGKVLMMMPGKTDEAISCFETVDIQRLSVPEVYQNLGVSYLLGVMGKGWIPPEEMPFLLPIEPDMSSRLLVQARGLSDAQEREKNKMLRNAEKYLQQAYMMGGSVSAGMSLAVSQLLLGNPAASIGTINKLGEKRPATLLVRGIAYLKDGRKDQAMADFRQIEKEPGILFETNRKVFGEVVAKGWKGVAPRQSESRGGLRVRFREALPESSELWSVPPVSEVPFPISVNRTGFGDLYRFWLPVQEGRRYEEWNVAHVTRKGLANQRQIGIGDPEQQLTAPGGYGMPDHLLGASGDRRVYYVYYTAQVIFVVEDRKISGWYVYDRLR